MNFLAKGWCVPGKLPHSQQSSSYSWVPRKGHLSRIIEPANSNKQQGKQQDPDTASSLLCFRPDTACLLSFGLWMDESCKETTWLYSMHLLSPGTLLPSAIYLIGRNTATPSSGHTYHHQHLHSSEHYFAREIKADHHRFTKNLARFFFQLKMEKDGIVLIQKNTAI